MAAHQAGVGAEVLEYRPELALTVIGFLPGRALENADFADPGVLRRAADAVRRLHAGPRFAGDFDMFARQAGYLEVVRDHGHRPARRRTTTTPTPGTTYAERWRPRHGRPVPCNNDLLAANYIDDRTDG